jgi:hypothetical protein
MRSKRPSFGRTARQVCLVSWCLLLSTCTRQPPGHIATPDNVVGNLERYVDLRAGWRVRVVVPILRSGGFIATTTTPLQGQPNSLSTGADFIGYETEYYAVRPRDGSGIRIAFTRAEAVEQGKTSRRTRPMLQLFSLFPGARFVRLVYLIRESQADHNMTLLAVTDESTLDKLTTGVMLNDLRICKSSVDILCIEVPVGVAVIPEEKMRIDGRVQWRPVR